ncbi:3'-5' exonuclease, partial [Coprobacillus cateniformis]|nr:3'-5' exonuclease [Coprobacillus cateniformis]
MIKIKDMKCGNDNVEFTAMISHVTTGKTNGANKSNYLSIVFQDETGTIDAKLWNASDEQIKTLTTGAVVRGKGDIIKYSDDRQMKVIGIDNVSYQENQQVQFLSKAPLDADVMIKEMMEYVKHIS